MWLVYTLTYYLFSQADSVIIIIIFWNKYVVLLQKSSKVLADQGSNVQERHHHHSHSDQTKRCLGNTRSIHGKLKSFKSLKLFKSINITVEIYSKYIIKFDSYNLYKHPEDELLIATAQLKRLQLGLLLTEWGCLNFQACIMLSMKMHTY